MISSIFFFHYVFQPKEGTQLNLLNRKFTFFVLPKMDIKWSCFAIVEEKLYNEFNITLGF